MDAYCPQKNKWHRGKMLLADPTPQRGRIKASACLSARRGGGIAEEAR